MFWQSLKKNKNTPNQEEFFDNTQRLINKLKNNLKLDARIEIKIRNIIRGKPVI